MRFTVIKRLKQVNRFKAIMAIMPRPAERPGDRVSADLRKRLASDEWASGEVLPTTRGLAEAYEVSQATVSRVIRQLETEGLVRTIDRWAVVKV